MSYGHFSEIAWVRIKPRRGCRIVTNYQKRINEILVEPALPARQGFIKTNK